MPQDSPKNQIAKLRAEIAEHERLYRIENAPVISDDDFDLLVRQLKELEAKYPQYADESSPSRIVGNDLSGAFVAVEHLSPMKSLDNVFNSSELEEFDSRLHKTLGLGGDFMYCVEPKIDGAGISAVYEDGKLARLLTRGDGTKGDDITRNAFLIKNIPMVLSGEESGIPTLLEVRGEAYMENSEFQRIYKLQREALIEKALEKKAKESSKDLLRSGGLSCGKSISLSEGELAEIEKTPIDPKREVLNVDITGEIYLVNDDFSNQNIERELGRMGVQTRRSLTVSSFLKDAIIPKAFRKGETHLQRAERLAKPYLMRDIGGDALECVSDVAYANEQHKDGIIHISPFTCMPEIMSQNIFPAMRKDCEVPILTLIMDEQTGRAGYITRLEAFVDLMRRKQRKAKQAKAAAAAV